MPGFDIAGMPYSHLKTAIDDAERLFALLLSRIWIKPCRSQLCLGKKVKVVAILKMVWWGQNRKTCTKS